MRSDQPADRQTCPQTRVSDLTHHSKLDFHKYVVEMVLEAVERKQARDWWRVVSMQGQCRGVVRTGAIVGVGMSVSVSMGVRFSVTVIECATRKSFAPPTTQQTKGNADHCPGGAELHGGREPVGRLIG